MSVADVEDSVEAADTPAVGKLAAQVARRIEEDVVRRGWPVGRSLGSEPDLRERYEVSRSVLREAVRLVEHHQVARMRRGPNGGLFVISPDAAPAAWAMVVYLEYVGTSLADLMEARRLLEPLAAGLAAQHISEDGIGVVRRTVEGESSTDEPDGRPMEALHLVIGELSGNSVLQLFVDVLIRLTTRFSVLPVGTDEYRRARDRARRYHAEIADAVIVGDVGKAQGRLGSYLDGVATFMQTHARSGPPQPRPITEPAVDGLQRPKLAEVVTGRLRDDIAAAGWQVGSVVGSESELRVRYGISRAVLREAVRLLEYHSIAHMRRGPGGGLVVGTPDPQPIIATMALYLEYMKVSAADLVAVRESIEMGIISAVTARHGDADLVASMDRALEWIDDPSIDDQGRADHFHTQLAEMAGNPVLAVFLQILAELWRRHAAAHRAAIAPEVRAQIEHVHHRITEAVLAGDEGLARYRMRRHLTAISEWWH